MFVIKINDDIIDVINYRNNKVITMNYFDFDGTYELIEDVLIIQWSNGITHYYIKNENIYEHYIFKNFDITYYSQQRKKFLTWNECFKDWIIEGRRQNIQYKKTFILYTNYKIKKLDKINETTLIDKENINYNYKIENEILTINDDIYYLFNNNVWVDEKTEFYDTDKWTDVKNYKGSKKENGFFVLNEKIIIKSNKIFKNHNIVKIKDNYYDVINYVYLNDYSIPENFDWIYYLKNIEHKNYNTLTKNEAYEIFLSNEHNYIDNSKILINEEIKNIVINHSYKTIKGLNLNEYLESIEIIKNSVLKISLINNEIKYYAKLNDDYYEEINYQKQTIFEMIKTVYIISNLNGGGAVKYLNDIKNKYNNVKYKYIKSNDDLLSYSYETTDLIFIQHLFLTDIKLNDLINVKIHHDPRMIISIHDFYWIEKKDVERNFENQIRAPWHSNYLHENNIINKEIIKLFELCEDILHPSLFTYKNYSKYFDNHNFNLTYHNDYEEQKNINYNKIKNNIITIGIMHELTTYKGIEQINFLMNNFTRYKNYQIKYLIVYKNLKPYEENEFNNVVIENNIHGFFLLNKWGETHCYLLTKIFNIGLPLLYNNFGAFKERINSYENYYKVYETENDVDLTSLTFTKLINTYYKFLDDIILNSNKNIKISNNVNINYNPYYDKLFSSMKNKESIVKPYAIYFPQFHSFKENNLNYYKGFSDTQNLKAYLLNSNNEENLHTPNMKLYGYKSIDDYDLNNFELQQKQINIAKKYGLSGFAIYYYWFSKNTITNENVIMSHGYDNFFKSEQENFNFYFVWANEDWSNNPAFNTSNLILNEYNDNEYNKNLKNLLKYFKHVNYLKIDNKPVFYIHHPQYIKNLNKLYNVFDNFCIQNGFNGIHMIYNHSTDQMKNYDNTYHFHPNYKKIGVSIYYDENNKAMLNYDKYYNHNVIKNHTHPECVFMDFNNTARLYIPDKLKLKTYTSNNSLKNVLRMFKNAINSYYKNEKYNNILLINAWNEWGEKMHIEPSEEYGFKFLNMLKGCLNNA